MLFVSWIHDPVDGAEHSTSYCQIAKNTLISQLEHMSTVPHCLIIHILNSGAFAPEKIVSLKILSG